MKILELSADRGRVQPSGESAALTTWRLDRTMFPEMKVLVTSSTQEGGNTVFESIAPAEGSLTLGPFRTLPHPV